MHTQRPQHRYHPGQLSEKHVHVDAEKLDLISHQFDGRVIPGRGGVIGGWDRGADMPVVGFVDQPSQKCQHLTRTSAPRAPVPREWGAQPRSHCSEETGLCRLTFLLQKA